MKTLVALGLASVGVAFLYLPRESRGRLTTAVGHWITGRMERTMASLPEGSPPKLVISILPRLRDQNDRIIALLQEQNGLLREWQRNIRHEG
jgi:hypothetical protein